VSADPDRGSRLVHGGTIKWALVTDWSSLVVPAPPESDPFDIGGVAEIKARHGLEEVVKLHWNENLFGPLPGVLESARAELEEAWMYPEEAYQGFRSDVADSLGTTPSGIFPGHGTQALIGVLATTFLRPGDAVVVPELTYYLYARACAARGATVHRVPMRELAIDLDALADTARTTGARIVWICDPNNPTGGVVAAGEWPAFLDALPARCVAIVDEAYVDFLPVDRRLPRLQELEGGKPLVLLRSFSKFYGLAGLRLGYAVVDEALAGYLALVEEPYNVNVAALAAGRACLRATEAAERRRGEVAEARATLADGLRAAGLEPLPSEANFVMARVDVDDAALADGLAASGLLIRPGTDFGLPGYVRITVGPVALMTRVSAEVRDVCARLRG
jgi:histidinol-phosphate aminotransferase